MKSRKTIFLLAMLVVVTELYAQQDKVNYNEDGSLNTELDYNRSSSPLLIETILYNPDVTKKQLSKNEVQAVSIRNNNEYHFVVHFFKNQLHNTWKTYYSNNVLCDSGTFSNGLPDGSWKTWYPDGQLKSVRNYSVDKFHYIKADLHRNHPRQPKYKITEYSQKRRNVAQHFQPVYASESSASAKPLLEKINHNTNGDGSNYIAPYTHSLHQGEFLNYNPDGSIKDSGHYDNGLKHGVWIETEKDGVTRSMGFYKHGLRNGQWKHYNMEGTLLYSDFYNKNGVVAVRHHFKK